MSTQPQPVDLSLSEGHTPGPWIWIYPEGFDGPYYEGQLPRIESGSGACVAAFGDSTQYYPTEGETPEAADRELIASAPAMRSELVRLREDVRTAAESIEIVLGNRATTMLIPYERMLQATLNRLRAALSQGVSDGE
jgi:hypothetical protein